MPKDAAGLAEQLKLTAHNVEENRADDALLYELILKSNLTLTNKVQSCKSGAQTFYDVANVERARHRPQFPAPSLETLAA